MNIEQEDVKTLRRRLRALLGEARNNEEKMRRFQEHESRLLGIRSLDELIVNILTEQRRNFDLDQLQLILKDPDHEIEHLLLQHRAAIEELPGLRLIHGNAWKDHGSTAQPTGYIGRYHADRDGHTFSPDLGIESFVTIPLVRQDQGLGTINLGSTDPARFIEGQGTDLLNHFGQIVAVCIENALNHERLRHIGLTDPLTGVNNRRFFDQRLEEELSRFERQQNSLSCMFLDLDFFKQVNDNYGHQIGDLVLRDTATIIKSELRTKDTLARYGGEEFVALLADTDEQEATRIAERIRENIAGKSFDYPNSEPLRLTVSIGIATAERVQTPGGETELKDNLVKSADQAVYQAKEGGRNRVVVAQSPVTA